MQKHLYLLWVIILITTLNSCTENHNMHQIKTGDLVFRGNTKPGLSSAINKVTQTNTRNNYSHIGICSIENDTVWVYHAAPEKGVCREHLENFLQPDLKNKYNIDLYRVEKLSPQEFSSIINTARTYIEEPYDYTYIMENDGFYCSEYIYEIFKPFNTFSLNPMTFKDPDTKNFNPTWVEHYKKLGIEIPENKLGCNPNGMAQSEHLIFINKIQ